MSSASTANEGRVVSSDGCAIAYRVDGASHLPPLVLSNSLGTAMAMWDLQIAALSASYRIVRYDSRGHGQSDAPPGPYAMDRLGQDVLDLLDSLSVGTASFCGLSMGGMVGQWLGFRAPDRLERLVLANTSAYMGPPGSWDARMATVSRSGTTAIADAVIDRWFTAPFIASHPEAVGAIAAMLRQTDDQGYAGCCAAIRDMDYRFAASKIAAPTLVIAGDQDPATPIDQARALAAAIPGAQLKILSAAHLSNVEQPALFTKALLDFVSATF